MRSVSISLFLLLSAGAAGAAELTREAIEQATYSESAGLSPSKRSPLAVKLQILLDRAHISPGVIDGHFGENLKTALKTFEQRESAHPDGKLDEDVWQKLEGGSAEVLMKYEITADDVSGPFVEATPDDLREMAKMDRLAYTGPEELLAEKFHMSEELLRELNPDADFSKAGTRVIVAAVREPKAEGKVERIEVDKHANQVRAYAGGDRLVVAYPATIGSKENPSPSGTVKVQETASDPVYYYRPDENFKIDDVEEPLEVPAGPNNPVGSMWIGLDKEGYGIHGTPEPAEIGKTSSNGCVRLTNWDAEELAELVRQGTPVHFLD